MLFKRKDGYPIKNIDTFSKFIPLIMKERNDAMVSLTQEISLEPIDNYIRVVYKNTGVRLSYMHVIYSALARTYAVRPNINRFIMNGRFYMRNDILFSMVVKKELSFDAEETTLKLKFTGEESPIRVREILNESIKAEKDKDTSGNNATDMFLKALSKTPIWLLKLTVSTIKYLDKINLIPMSALEASPFHASAFITNLGSIGLDAAQHHIYNFGTIGGFLAIGKKDKKIVKKNGEFKEEKIMNIGFVIDERICDGFYYASAMRIFFKYLQNPAKLEEAINFDE